MGNLMKYFAILFESIYANVTLECIISYRSNINLSSSYKKKTSVLCKYYIFSLYDEEICYFLCTILAKENYLFNNKKVPI